MKNEIALPLFPGFYNTIFEIDSLFRLEDEEDKPTEEEYDRLDFKEMQNDAARQICKATEQEFEYLFRAYENSKVEFIFKYVDSPQYYNYRNDMIVVDATFNKKFVVDRVNEIKGILINLIKYKYEARDGYLPLVSNNFDKFWDNGEALEDEAKCGGLLEMLAIIYKAKAMYGDNLSFKEYDMLQWYCSARDQLHSNILVELELDHWSCYLKEK